MIVPNPEDGAEVVKPALAVIESGMMDGKVSRLVTEDVVEPVPGSLEALLNVGSKELEPVAVIGETSVLLA